MISPAGRPVVLVMRRGLRIRYDHVETMFRLGLVVHLLTEEDVRDVRCATVRVLSDGLDTDGLAEEVLAELRATGAEFAVTFQETDIVAVGRANAAHGVAWARPEADAIARDKTLQRAHLAEHGLPSPKYAKVGRTGIPAEVFAHVGLPCIVKPSRGASSTHVELVDNAEAAAKALAAIVELAESGAGHFYDTVPEEPALVEEYLPGAEMTCDGVVVDGRFHLGGVNTKVLPHPPWFEEDLYTLPHGDPAVEALITDVMTRLARSLDLDAALLNAEFRYAADGTLRIVEFSTRISGGHVYRNVRDVHAVDLVEVFLRAAFGQREVAAEQAAQRHPGRVATCIKFLYRTGEVVSNSVGPAGDDPALREYYALAGAGETVRSAPEGFDICGLLSVWGPYDPESHPAAIHATAEEVAGRLALEVRPLG